MKKIIMLGLALSILLSAQLSYKCNTAFADPFIKIDYGETSFNHSLYWLVDKGSIRKSGTAANPQFFVYAGKESSFAVFCERKYYFAQKDGNWKYCYESWTGKGVYKGKSSWHYVSSDKLANDILYIVLN